MYGITSRGFGNSSAAPAEASNCSVSRLGDDVATVISTLKLSRPVLAGHSAAGKVLSAVAARHPDAVLALIYIDAGYPYALYHKAHGDLVLDLIALRNELDQAHIDGSTLILLGAPADCIKMFRASLGVESKKA
jgi:non-heme chloroperoxidase